MKCPNCNKELKQLKGKYKIAIQLSGEDEIENKKKELMNQMKHDTIIKMNNSYNELRELLIPVMHDKLTYTDSSKFIQDGKLKKSFEYIKKIVGSHQWFFVNLGANE